MGAALQEVDEQRVDHTGTLDGQRVRAGQDGEPGSGIAAVTAALCSRRTSSRSPCSTSVGAVMLPSSVSAIRGSVLIMSTVLA